VVVDGRQAGYSEGATLVELGELLLEKGAFFAMNLDGGGSSTMVMAQKNGKAHLLNSPIDVHIPGRERAVGNHLGIYASTSE
jgi:exopolysaccharide biosynthesis protein